ncbi:MAG: hypothetical protein AAFQ02_01360 [Bacteroidota bacterium]
MKGTVLALAFFASVGLLPAQSFIFGPKLGPTLGVQTWNGIDRQPLVAYHAALYLESYNPDRNGSFFGQLGYHLRGSSQNVTFFNVGGNPTGRSRPTFEFRNVAATIGAKRRIDTFGDSKPYYSFAMRVEYTLGTNLDQYNNAQFATYFPVDPFVNKFNYGATVAFGYEFPFSELVGGFVEANISPDLSRQYEQPTIPNVLDPFTGNSISLREQTIRNITFEVSVGLRFLRKVIYLEDY